MGILVSSLFRVIDDIDTVNVRSDLDGSMEDIFRLIFSKRPSVLDEIRAHHRRYPECLELVKKCSHIVEDKILCGTPLFFASQFSREHSSLQIVKLLLALGANVNQGFSDPTFPEHRCHPYLKRPLHVACQYTQTTSTLETVKVLVRAGADVNSQGVGCYSPLMVACTNEFIDTDLVDFLIREGCNINATGCRRSPDSSKTYIPLTVLDILYHPPITLHRMEVKDLITELCDRMNWADGSIDTELA